MGICLMLKSEELLHVFPIARYSYKCLLRGGNLYLFISVEMLEYHYGVACCDPGCTGVLQEMCILYKLDMSRPNHLCLFLAAHSSFGIGDGCSNMQDTIRTGWFCCLLLLSLPCLVLQNVESTHQKISGLYQNTHQVKTGQYPVVVIHYSELKRMTLWI